MSLFEKQMLPILNYGSVFWGMSGSYNRMYIENIPESVNTVDEVKKFVRDDSIKHIRRVGRKSTVPRKLILTTDSYESKIRLLINLETTEDFQILNISQITKKYKQNFLSLYSILTDMQVTMQSKPNWENIQ